MIDDAQRRHFKSERDSEEGDLAQQKMKKTTGKWTSELIADLWWILWNQGVWWKHVSCNIRLPWIIIDIHLDYGHPSGSADRHTETQSLLEIDWRSLTFENEWLWRTRYFPPQIGLEVMERRVDRTRSAWIIRYCNGTGEIDPSLRLSCGESRYAHGCFCSAVLPTTRLLALIILLQ